MATAAIAAAVAPGQVSYAQEAPAEAASGEEEVVVTARRREEAVERVPVSVSVLSADSLEKRGVSTQADLQVATPGLVVRATQGNDGFNYAIRGQSIDAFTASQPGVLTYVNEFATTALSAGSLYDLQSVQVLKGPQGTLFGRNTTGGAVLYTTAKPEFDENSASAKVRIGNFDLRSLEASVNTSSSDTFALRLSGSMEKRNGTVINLVNGEDLNDIDRQSLRVSARWAPTAAFEASVVGEYNTATGNGTPFLLYSANAPGSTDANGLPLVSTIASFYGPLLDTIAGPGSFDALRAQYPLTPADGYLGVVDQQRERGSRFVAYDADTGLDAESYYVVNTLSYEISENATIKNIIGYAFNENWSDFDQDASPFPFYKSVRTINRSKVFSEELQISGTTPDDRLTYIAGVYYSNEKRRNGQYFSYFDLGPVANPVLGPVFGGTLPLSNILLGDFDVTSIGAYAQGSYKILDNLSLTAGVRYTREETDFTELSGFAPFFPSGIEESRSDEEPSWTLGAEYQATDDLFVYATYRGSWRGGGYNYNAPPINLPADQGGNTFGPETTQDVELGMKFRGKIGSTQLRANIAVFKQWVDDVQRVAYVNIPGIGPAAVTFSAPGAEFKGVEADVEFMPTDWLKIGAAFSYTDAKYTDTAVNNLFGTFFQFSTFADIPETSGSIYVEGTWDLPDDAGELSVRLDAYAQSSMYISNYGKTSAPNTQIPSYEVFNARIGLSRIAGSNVNVALFGRNIFDEDYYVGGIGLGTSPGYNTVLPGDPATYGIEIGIDF
jgi:iron complex outermembrane receptor protein